MEYIKSALELKSELDGLRPIDTEQEERIMQKFRLDWNYHSNHLEGNTLTYGETKALLLFGITAQGKPLKDTLEITGHNEAIDWVIDMVKGERPLTENFIRELHKLLLREPYEKKAINGDGLVVSRTIQVGSYKTVPNHVKTITGEIFYFATPEETPAKMHDLLTWYNEKKEDTETNPILLAAEFHYKFIRIHPFDDGNGRTARILMNFILMQYDFPPVIIKTQDKENYFTVLRMADAGNLEAFINYIAENLNHSLEIMIAGAQGENIEDEDDLDKEIALLEQRLKNYGEKIEKSKSEELVNSILYGNVFEICTEIKEKLKKFEEYYLFKNIFIVINNQSFNFESLKELELNREIRELKIVVNYNTLKKTGLESFRFYYEILFEFNLLYYEVFEDNYEVEKERKFRKQYVLLSKSELDMLISKVIKTHNLKLDNAIKNK